MLHSAGHLKLLFHSVPIYPPPRRRAFSAHTGKSLDTFCFTPIFMIQGTPLLLSTNGKWNWTDCGSKGNTTTVGQSIPINCGRQIGSNTEMQPDLEAVRF